MSTERFGRLKRLLIIVTGLPGNDRPAYLDKVCEGDPALRRELESLLAHEASAEDLLKPRGFEEVLKSVLGKGYSAGAVESHPERIGRYRIDGVLGEGGMGVIYHATQSEPIQREVAIKLIRRGYGSGHFTARFEAERQTLAKMNHPHIARIFDAGTDDSGNPYFVMEIVEGMHCVDFCREEQLSTEGRLRLFLDICRAVQHAHQKGIIHRDLKPSNILVSMQDDVPFAKVIDFGIAKLMEQSPGASETLTQEGRPIGTPRYMSPEQARGSSDAIDTRTDVYSLGIILYELVTESPPYETRGVSLIDLPRVICETQPAPFARKVVRGRKIDPDLQTIVFKAISKDMEERYPSASALGEDVERYLSSEPILARRPSAVYQMRKLIARNRIPSILVAGFVFMVIAFGVWMSVLYTRSEANLKRAIEAEGEATEVSGFMIDLFQVSDPSEARGSTITAREILDEGAERIEKELSDRPEIQARMMRTIGVVYRGLGLYDEAGTLLEGALERQGTSGGGEDLEAAASGDELATLHERVGRYEDAEKEYKRALAIREGLLGPVHPDVAISLGNLGWLYCTQGRISEGKELLDRSAAILDQTPEPDPRTQAGVLNNLALVCREQGNYKEAEPLFLRSLAIREDALGTDHPDIAVSLNNLALCYWGQGRYEEALQSAKRSLVIREKILGPEHPDLARALTSVATLHQELSNFNEAEPLYQRALTIQEKVLGANHYSVAVTLNNLGRLFTEWGRPREAEGALKRSLAIRKSALGADHPKVSNALISLGELFTGEGRYEEADSLLQAALAIRESSYGGDHPNVALALYDIGILRLEQSRYEEAEPLLLRALDIREAKLDPSHYRIAESLDACARLYLSLNRPDEAAAMTERAASIRKVSS